MYFRKTIAILCLAVSFASIAAKPTDKQILKDISRPNMQDIQFSKSGGSYSVYRLQRMWTRGVTYKLDADIKEYPDAKIVVGAQARYQIVGENYDFDQLKTVWTEYEGIPTPTDAEILNIIKANIVSFVGSHNWNQMVKELDGPYLSQDPAIRKIQWHTANSFSINLQAKYSVISSYTEVQDISADFEVRFYRDAVNKPWKDNFYSHAKNKKTLTTHKYTADEIKAMPTMASKEAEKQAQEATSRLPSITIPKFVTDKDAFVFIYEQLRTGDKKQVEAMFRAMASVGYFVEGSKIRLNQRGQEVLDKLILKAFDGKVTFADSYCPQIFIKSYQTNMINIVDALRKNTSRIALTIGGGHYEKGKKVDQDYKISAIEVWTLRTDDDVSQFKSWPFDELCADVAKSFQQLGSNKSTTNTSASNKAGTKSSVPATIIKQPAKSWVWTTFKSQYLPISMKLIGTATEKQKMDNGKLNTTMIAQTEHGTFRMVATDYKQQITAEIATPTHVQFAKNFVKSNNALIHKKKVVALGTGDALEYLIETGSGEQKVMVAFRIFSNDTIVYQVMYSQLKSRFDKVLAQEFMQSIKLQ